MERPSQTAPSPNTRCALTFQNADKVSPSRKKFMVSLLNVENVVKPPSTPMKTRARVSAVNTPRASANCERKPMIRHPITLTASVPNGKAAFCIHCWTRPLNQ